MIPFLTLGAMGIAALTGTNALFKNSEAEGVSNAAKAIYDHAKERAEKARANANYSLEELGSKKLYVLDRSVNEFILTFEQVHEVQFKGPATIKEAMKFELDEQSVLKLRELGSMATAILGGTVGGIGAGALTALGAYNAVTTFAVASTGTAISALSGVAAANATLAFLGGGTIAAGGGGVLMGSATLGGAVVAPAAVILGIRMNAVANKNLENAKTMVWEAREAAEGLNVITTLCNGITGRAKMFSALLENLDAMLVSITQEMKAIITKSGCDYKLYNEAEQGKFAMAISVAGAIKRVLDTPILDEDGSLSMPSVETRDAVIDYLKAVDSKACNNLPLEPSEQRENVDFARRLAQKAESVFKNNGTGLLDDSRVVRNIVNEVCRSKVEAGEILRFWDGTIGSTGKKGVALTIKGVFDTEEKFFADYLDIVKTEINYGPTGVYIYTSKGERHYISDITVAPYKLKEFLDYASSLYEKVAFGSYDLGCEETHAKNQGLSEVSANPAVASVVEQVQNLVSKAPPSVKKPFDDIMHVFCDILNPPQIENSTGNKDISEFYPYMKDHFVDMKLFAKIELLSTVGLIMEDSEIRQLRLSDIDRYMLDHMHYQVGADIAPIECDEAGIPKSLKSKDRVVAKSILRIPLSNEESGVLKSLKDECMSASLKYQGFAVYVGMLKENMCPKDKDYFYKEIIDARKSGWFDDLPAPTEEEERYRSQLCSNN